MTNHALRLILVLALAGCGLSPRVNPGMDGEVLTVHNLSYEQVWAATYGAVHKEFYYANETKKKEGIIHAGANGCAFGPDDYIGVYITPTTAEANTYHIKIVVNGYGDNPSNTSVAKKLGHEIEAGLHFP